MTVAPEPGVPWWAAEDPWTRSPEEQARLDEYRAAWAEAMARIPSEPPF